MNITSASKWQFLLALILFVPISILGAYLFGIFDGYKSIISPDIEILHLLGKAIILPVVILKESGVTSSESMLFLTIMTVELIWVFLLIKATHTIWLMCNTLLTNNNAEGGGNSKERYQRLATLILICMAFSVFGYLIGREEKKLSQEEFNNYADARLFEFMCETNHASYKRISNILDKLSEGVTFSDSATRELFGVLKDTVSGEYLLYENECAVALEAESN